VQVDVDQKYKVMGIYIGSPDRATMAVLVDRLGYAALLLQRCADAH
jgi:hypothetical protein